MSYNAIDAADADPHLKARVAACFAQETASALTYLELRF